MANPVVRYLVPSDRIIVDRPCIYHGAILIGGGSASSTFDLHDGSSTQGERLDRLVAGISAVDRAWYERGIECSFGIYANVDGNQSSAVVLYSELDQEEPE